VGGELGKEISETTLNRELQTMRRMMKDAHAEGWISRDPFVNAKVIKIANEKERSREEEQADHHSILHGGGPLFGGV
jgi:site-specific recombinase XerD